MSNVHSNRQGQENGHAPHISDEVKANADRAADKTTEQTRQFADVTRDGVNRIRDMHEKATETTKQVIQSSIDSASEQARESADRFSKKLGFFDEGSEQLANQSRQNMEAVSRCGTVLSHAFQDAARSIFDLGQKQFQRNLEGMSKLTGANSLQEFYALQSDLMREGLQLMIQDSKAITDTSARAIEEANKSFSSAVQAR